MTYCPRDVRSISLPSVLNNRRELSSFFAASKSISESVFTLVCPKANKLIRHKKAGVSSFMPNKAKQLT